MTNYKIGIIGKGFVGSAVSDGFSNIEQYVVDPKISEDNTIDKLVNDFDPPLTFVCVPTPPNEDGSVNVDIVTKVLQELNDREYKGIVVVKSTIIPDYLHVFKKSYKLKIVYNPEFLTEANASQDFVNPNMQVLGGKWKDCDTVEKAYNRYSNVRVVPTFKVDLSTASLIKYTINSWLATKVIWFNQLKDLYDDSGARASWKQFTDMLNEDPRVGDSHMQVPGPDGIKGFGGHCFPKDTKALLYYSKLKSKKLRALEHIIKYNAEYRDD
jgi:UDPglucose 6-dehydrogenase